MKPAGLVALATVIVTTSYLAFLEPSTSPQAPTSFNAGTNPAAPRIAVPIVDPQQNTAPFEIDDSRLYDLSYLTDPALVGYAESIDRTPECVVQRARLDRYDAPTHNPRDDVCYSVTAKKFTIPMEPENLGFMTIGELKALAETQPAANLMLAYHYHRSQQFADAERVLERAVALSGSPNPLYKIAHANGVTNDMLRWEIYLTAETLGRKNHPMMRELLREKLTIEERQIAERRAQDRVARLTALRDELVGRPWGSS